MIEHFDLRKRAYCGLENFKIKRNWNSKYLSCKNEVLKGEYIRDYKHKGGTVRKDIFVLLGACVVEVLRRSLKIGYRKTLVASVSVFCVPFSAQTKKPITIYLRLPLSDVLVKKNTGSVSLWRLKISSSQHVHWTNWIHVSWALSLSLPTPCCCTSGNFTKSQHC